MIKTQFNIAETQNCETAYLETSNSIPSYTSEVTTTTYQISDSLSCFLSVNKADIPSRNRLIKTE